MLAEKLGVSCGREVAEKGQLAGGFHFFILGEETGGGNSIKVPEVAAK